MKLIGPTLLLMTLVLASAILWFPKAVWSIGGVTIFAVLISIAVTLIADMRASKARDQ